MSENKENNQVNAVSNTKIDAIKEIIFGNEMKNYDKEFKEIRDYITENLNAIDRKFAEMKDAQEKMHKTIMDQMEKNHQKVLSEMAKLDEKKTDRKKLAKHLEDIATKISG